MVKRKSSLFKITLPTVLVFAGALLILFSDKLFTPFCTNAFPWWCYSAAIIGPLYQGVTLLLFEKTPLYYVLSIFFLVAIILVGRYFYGRITLRYKNKILMLSSFILLCIIVFFFQPLNLQHYTFYDPTGDIRLNVSVVAQGTTIFKDQVNATTMILLYGFYDLHASALFFEKDFEVRGNALLVPEKRVYLFPDRNQILVTEQEFNFVKNYLEDFQKLFAALPNQYYLYKKGAILSFGDVLLLQCEQDAFARNRIKPQYFFPKQHSYNTGIVEQKSNCYAKIIVENIQPINLNVLNITYTTDRYNVRKRGPLMSFTFDIESGRYLNEGNKGKQSLSPCDNEFFSLGLAPQERHCDNADILPHFSNHMGNIEGYPWSTGIDGFEEILDYSLRYGVPTTNYVVIRDLKVFDQLRPTLNEKLQKLVEEGFVELGVHTYYHRYLGKEPIGDKKELEVSKHYIEERFHTSVEGMRSPYLTHIGNDPAVHALALKQLNYTYFSNLGEPKMLDNIASVGPNLFVVSDLDRETMQSVLRNSEYILTLDHPWNLGYREVSNKGEIYLDEDKSRKTHFRKAILLSMNEGGVFMQTKDLIKQLKFSGTDTQDNFK